MRASVPPTRDRAHRERTLAITAVSVTTVLWGLAGVLVKSTSLPSLVFAMYRLWLGVLVYAAILLATRRRLPIATVRACAIGGVLFATDLAFTFSAFKLTTLANANIIGALSPVAIALVGARLFKEPLGPRELTLAGVSFAGVVVVAVGAQGVPAWSPLGDLFALCSVGSWTSYWLFSKRARHDVPAIEYMASVMLVAAIVITPVAVLSGQPLDPPHGADWAWISLVVLFPGAIGHTLVAWSHRHLEAWLGSLITQCSPVVAAIAAWVALGEALTPLVVAGGLIVLGATAVLVAGARRDAVTPPGP